MGKKIDAWNQSASPTDQIVYFIESKISILMQMFPDETFALCCDTLSINQLVQMYFSDRFDFGFTLEFLFHRNSVRLASGFGIWLAFTYECY